MFFILIIRKNVYLDIHMLGFDIARGIHFHRLLVVLSKVIPEGPLIKKFNFLTFKIMSF